jgi:hypothetical protein
MKQFLPYTIQSGMSKSGSYILMLRDTDGGMQIPILIGTHEAQGILMALEKVATRRPMTHDLMLHIMEEYALTLKEVTIDRVNEGIFYASLHLSDGFNEKRFDSRPSDAITLALFCNSPIMVAESVVEETGMRVENEDKKTDNGKRSIEELEAELKRCEESEEYERAAEIQKEIEKLRMEK